MTAPVPSRSGVRRSRTGAVLGGVCAGVARSAGLDPLLLRIAVVAVTLLTGGAGLLAYLVAWVLIPREEPSAADVQALGGAAAAPPRVDVRAAWSAAGKDLRSLAGELRRPQSAAPADPVAEAAPAAAGSPPAPGSRRPRGPGRGRARPGCPDRRDPGRPAGRGRPVPALTAGRRRRGRDRPRRAPARPRGAGRGPARGRQRDAGPGRQRRRGRQARPPRPHAPGARAGSGAGSRVAPRVAHAGAIPPSGADRPGSGDQRPLRDAGSRHDPGYGNVRDARPEATGR